MPVNFSPYDTGHATMRMHRAPRLRLTDRANVLLLHRAPNITQRTSLTLHATMALRHPAPRLRMADTSNVFLLHRAPRVSLSGSSPMPTAAVFSLAGPGHAVRIATTLTLHATMAFHRAPRVLLAGPGTRIVLHRTHTVYLYDGTVSTDRVAMLLQQPVMTSNMSPGITLSLTSVFQTGELASADFIHALLDLIAFSDGYSHAAQILQALADGMSLADVAQMIIQADLLDSFIASMVQAGTAQITVMLADTLLASDAPTSLSDILAALHDGFYCAITVNTGADTFTAWVMTPQTKAMRSYSNWNFNSYATIGGQFLAAGPAGIYRMGGATDAGAAICSAIRTGKLNFGSMAMKSAPLVYIGATTSGDLLMKVQATTVRGADLEQTYRMTPAVTGAPREHRVPVGKGFRAVYWTFELANDADGATFEVHEWHAVPIIHTGKLI